MATPEYPRPVSDEKVPFQGKILEIVRQDNEVVPGKVVTFEWARRSPGVRLLVMNRDRTKVLLTREYRSELKDYDYRLAGGKVFDTLEKYNNFLATKQDVAVRASDKVVGEAVEETGLVVKTAELFHTSKLGATVEWDLLYFVVGDYEEHPDGQNLEDGENISVEWVPIDQAREMAMSGHMSEERSALILLRFLNTL